MEILLVKTEKLETFEMREERRDAWVTKWAFQIKLNQRSVEKQTPTHTNEKEAKNKKQPGAFCFSPNMCNSRRCLRARDIKYSQKPKKEQ